jgi:uncharacterized protein YjeT (DUF2065 family)
LVLEGLFPFVAPRQWRRSLSVLAGLDDQRLRFFGLAAIIAGLVLLFSVRG